MRRIPGRDILGLFFVTRLLLMLATYFGYILLTAPKYSSTQVDIPAFFTSWNHWDATRYINIAQYGYQTRYDFAFFPLFPLLTAAIAYPLGSWSYLAVGTLISNAALLGTLFILYRLAIDIGGERVAFRTLLYLCIFPTALFFFAAYNESLFLLLTTGTFLAMRHQRWWLAGLLGLLAALTRSAGILLVIPYLYELWATRKNSTATLRTTLLGLLPVVLIPMGTVLYCIYCWQMTGNPIEFAAVQNHWARYLSWPWQGIGQALSELLLHQPFGSFYQVHTLLDLSATIAFIALAILGRHKLPTSYNLWTGFLLLYILLSPSTGQPDSLISNQRFVLELFPVFITLGMQGIQHPRLHQILMFLFPVLLATLSLLFFMGRWMV